MTTYRETSHTNNYEFTAGAGYQLPEYPFVEPPELHSATRVRHPVVIVGGGITGLTLACSLAKLGVPQSRIDTVRKSDDARRLATLVQELLAKD